MNPPPFHREDYFESIEIDYPKEHKVDALNPEFAKYLKKSRDVAVQTDKILHAVEPVVSSFSPPVGAAIMAVDRGLEIGIELANKVLEEDEQETKK